MNSIELKSVEYEYERDSNGLRDVSLALAKGSFTVLVGRSGSGKSTLLKMAGGLIAPNSGSVEVNGTPTFVFQSGALLPWKTVRDNILLGTIALHVSATEAHKRVDDALREVLIQDLADKYPREISGGERQRVGIARALAAKPDILLLDEPFSALDAETAHTLRNTLLDIWYTHKITILMVSHLIEEAIYLADKIVVIKEGRVVGTETVTIPRPRDMSALNLHSLAVVIEKKL